MKHLNYTILLISGLVFLSSPVIGQVFVESKKPEAVANQLFGWAIDSDWNHAIVAAPQKDIGDRQSVGSAFIYRLVDDVWEVEQEISPTNLPPFSNFGISASVAYNHAFIGSLGHPTKGLFSESVFVYEFNDTTWVNSQILQPSDPKMGNRFGSSMHTSDWSGVLAVGAPNADGNESKSGAVYVFEFKNEQWIQTAKLFAGDGQSHDYFGFSVSTHSYYNRILVGAYNATGSKERSGAVYVFEKNEEEEWVQTAKIFDSNGSSSDLFGYSLTSATGVAIPVKAVSGSIEDEFYIGAPGANNANNDQTGSVYFSSFDGENWMLSNEFFEPNSNHNDHFGISVAYNTYDGLFVGANRNGENNDGYVFKYDYDYWNENSSPELTSFVGNEGNGDYQFYGSRITTDSRPNLVVSSPNATVNGKDNAGAVDFYTTLITSNENDPSLITDYKLEQNYPNPFNPSTQIKYQVKETGFVKLSIFNLLGQEVQTLVNEQKNTGAYTVNFNASSLSSGFYFYRLEVNDFVSVKKMMLIK